MNVNDLAKMMGDACYGFLALNFLWGLYNIIMGFRRVKELNFSNHDEQAEFIDEVMPLLAGRPLRRRRRTCGDDVPCLAAADRTWRSPIATWATTSCAKSSPKSCSAT